MSQSDFLERVVLQLEALVAAPAGELGAEPGEPAGGIIVALSGGPDSVALLLACRAWGERVGRPVAAAHLNHLLRAEHANADAQFCRQLCEHLVVPFFSAEADPRPTARVRGQGLEEAGRHLRRGFLTGLLAEHPAYRWLATGHHRDDQIETVLMRLFRGTGPDGMRGIRPRAGVWLHPLLGEDRAGILEFLAQQGQAWRTDTSNLDGNNARARLRRELLPLARDIFGAGSLGGPARLAELWDQELELLDELTRQWLGTCQAADGTLSVTEVLRLDPAAARRVLQRWLTTAGVENLGRVHIEQLLNWLNNGTSGGVMVLPGGWEAAREFNRVLIRQTGFTARCLRFAEDYRIVVQSGDPAADPRQTGLAEKAGDAADESTWRLTCPADSLQGNLQVRRPRSGDRFRPFGLQGTKKLSEVLREHRVGREARQNVLVVADEADILWVVGLARAERTRLLPTTARTVTISVVKRSDTNQNKGQ